MRSVNLSNVDLNLLKTFMAIWEFRSLTQAGDVLHLSQPAVSHALRRLREVFNDPLFVRNGAVMVPTDAAVRLHPPIDDALLIIRGALQQHAKFDPAASERSFRLAMSDIAELHVLPLLLQALGEKAPGVRVQTRQMPVEELNVALRNGDVEVAIGYLPGLGDDCIGELMLRDDFVCLLRSAHPLASADLSLPALNELRYVNAQTNATGHGLAEHALKAAGIDRNIAVRSPHFTVCPHIVAKTDLALVLPRTIANAFNQLGSFAIKELPVDMPVIQVKIYSHKRFQADSGITWLRSQLMQLFKETGAGQEN
jgi:DNA-binding transcriptional LysR family regulator